MYSKNDLHKQKTDSIFILSERQENFAFSRFPSEGAACCARIVRKLFETETANNLYFYERWYILLTDGVK